MPDAQTRRVPGQHRGEPLPVPEHDGYAHTGNHGGRTLRDWWAKVRPGGILAGHDYHPQWPKNLAAVDAFRQAHADHITQFQITADDPFPSWVAVKGADEMSEILT